MVNTNTLVAPLFILSLCYVLYFYYSTVIITKINESKSNESFDVVASNTYNPPKHEGKSEKDLNEIKNQFNTLIKTINDTHYQASYEMENIVNAFEKILNQDIGNGKGSYKILSIDDSKSFTLYGVVVQEIESFFVSRFERVDFIVDSMNPFLIKNVIIELDQDFVSSQFVLPQDDLRDESMFRIKNKLHLFAPYKTSDNEMVKTSDDVQVLKTIIQKKQKQLEALWA
jgi:hypothetical protein